MLNAHDQTLGIRSVVAELPQTATLCAGVRRLCVLEIRPIAKADDDAQTTTQAVGDKPNSVVQRNEAV